MRKVIVDLNQHGRDTYEGLYTLVCTGENGDLGLTRDVRVTASTLVDVWMPVRCCYQEDA